MSAAGFPEGRKLKVEYLYPNMAAAGRASTSSKAVAAVPRSLIPSLNNHRLESAKDLPGRQYRGIAAWADIGLYQDPTLLPRSVSHRGLRQLTGWNDPRYDIAMAEAKSCPEPATRLKQLADCERMLLEAMPVIPLYFDAWQQLRKPYVRGIEGNAIDAIAFHRAWIDISWRPQ